MYEIRSKPGCIYCYRAEALLKAHNLPYKKIRFDSDADKQTMRQNNWKSWPIIHKSGVYIGGYDALMSKLYKE